MADKFLSDLIDNIQPNDFMWAKIDLGGGASVEVSHPYLAKGIFVPVTAKKHWGLAADFHKKGHDWYPLTRAVADRAHNQAIQKGMAVTFSGWPTLTDYKGFSKYLLGKYSKFHGLPDAVCSGGHKYWLLSTGPHGIKADGTPISAPVDKKAINYGFYKMAARQGAGPGPYLHAAWSVEQSLGGRHNAHHWDYSQLLQFMRNYQGGKEKDLRKAIVAGEAAVWDEKGYVLAPDVLPF
jgi:hypothetical protein